VHPIVLESHATGALHDIWNSARTTAQLRRGERATQQLLDTAPPAAD
jgi:hypothetical protein